MLLPGPRLWSRAQRLSGALLDPIRRMDFFFFNDTDTTDIYTLSLHDALPILCLLLRLFVFRLLRLKRFSTLTLKVLNLRSEERFSRNAETDLVCRLLLEK